MEDERGWEGRGADGRRKEKDRPGNALGGGKGISCIRIDADTPPANGQNKGECSRGKRIRRGQERRLALKREKRKEREEIKKTSK